MKESTPEEIEIARVYKRFYTALQLRDLCNEMPVHAVARKYDLPRGTIQNLAQTCHGFAAGMIKFCEKMDWGALAAVLDHYSDRLKAGTSIILLQDAEALWCALFYELAHICKYSSNNNRREIRPPRSSGDYIH